MTMVNTSPVVLPAALPPFILPPVTLGPPIQWEQRKFLRMKQYIVRITLISILQRWSTFFFFYKCYDDNGLQFYFYKYFENLIYVFHFAYVIDDLVFHKRFC